MSTVLRSTGVYFLFVMIMCCLELASTMLMMNLYNRATTEPATAMPHWVPHFTSSVCDIHYRSRSMSLTFTAETLYAVDIKSIYDEFLTLVRGIL